MEAHVVADAWIMIGMKMQPVPIVIMAHVSAKAAVRVGE
jgi:hypothetical protein